MMTDEGNEAVRQFYQEVRTKGKIIVLKYAGKCMNCRNPLPAGTNARWFGRGRVLGIECCESKMKEKAKEAKIPEKDKKIMAWYGD